MITITGRDKTDPGDTFINNQTIKKQTKLNEIQEQIYSRAESSASGKEGWANWADHQSDGPMIKSLCWGMSKPPTGWPKLMLGQHDPGRPAIGICETYAAEQEIRLIIKSIRFINQSSNKKLPIHSSLNTITTLLVILRTDTITSIMAI